MSTSEQKYNNIVQSLFCICLAVFIVYVTLTQFTIDEFSMGGSFASHAFYPQLIAGIMIFLSVLLILTSMFGKKNAEASGIRGRPGPAQQKAGQDGGERPEQISKWGFFGIVLLLLLYTVFLDLFGYIVTTPFFMAALFFILKIRKWSMIVLFSILSSGLIYVLFSMVLEVIFPVGKYSPIGF